ncbi:MAG: PAC2 family protein [Acidimicrobiaceae bacterium]|nr:PAC2 family protein [Ilumatobacter sp.]MCB9380238.1 PAC2 family protein [Acidimicrobiaceae bacterium]MCO5329384.1 PAC2 family protein [Ilumatobacteraceae bacterium]
MTDAATDYTPHEDLPRLDRPVLLVALGGWIDAGGAANSAMDAIRSACNVRPLATFDSDVFLDYRARRPVMELRDGVNTRLVWGEILLGVGEDPQGHPVLTLTGPEPDSQWRRFARTVSELALRLGVYQMVALGAYPFASPHTRPPRLAMSSPSAEVVARLPYLRSSVDVPAGMSAVLEHALTEAGVASVGLWAQVPHYLGVMAYPPATLALLNGVREATGVSIPAPDLAGLAVAQRERIDQLVAGNAEHAAMVRELEEVYDTLGDEALPQPGAELPSADDLAAEIEQFLRGES